MRSRGPPTVHVGTSGWQYRWWRGRFYPPSLPTVSWLAHYAGVFETVEVNNSFYRLPERSTFERWRDATPPGFLMAVKASRYITHVKRLRDPRHPVDLLLAHAAGLGPALGPVLVQLPPTLRVDIPLLRDALAAFDGRVRVAVEFRHPSWRDDAVFALLDGFGAAYVVADRPGVRDPSPVTGGWSYVRFHQGTRSGPGYRRDKLARWASRLAELPAQEIFAYFNNDEHAAAPSDARTLIGLLRDRGVPVARTMKVSTPTEGGDPRWSGTRTR